MEFQMQNFLLFIECIWLIKNFFLMVSDLSV